MAATTEARRRRGFGLGQRLALFMGLALTFGIGVVVTIGIAREVAELRAAFYAAAARSTDLMSQTLGGAVRFAKLENIAPALEAFRAGQETDIAWIAVTDATGAPILVQDFLATAGPALLAATMTRLAEGGQSLRLDGATAAPIRFGPDNAVVGGLVIGWSDADVMAIARGKAVELGLIGAAIALAFSGLAYLVLSRMVSAPIAAMDASLTDLADGRFERPVAGQARSDEIGAMARNLEHLRGALAEARAQRARIAEMEAAALTDREAMLTALRSGVGAVVGAAQAGDFSRRVEGRFDDEAIQSLATGVNAICAVISDFLDDGERALRALSHGDLGQAMSTAYSGRFDGFSRALNTTLDGLRSLVAQLGRTQSEIAGTVAEIGRDSDELSRRVITQATAMQETSATMVELSTTITQNADNARAAADAVGDARGQADVSRALIAQAIGAMKEIQSGASEITEIVNAIDGFAFQTNLLALNAAVEAARAGEAGKGFAVVASEVRTLAQRAAEAAKDIRRLITESRSNVDNGAKIVDATGTALSDILTSFVAIAPAMTDISNATREQSAGMGEMTSALAQIDDATQLNAHLAENGAMRAQALQEQSQALSQLIAFFHDRDDAGYAPARAAE